MNVGLHRVPRSFAPDGSRAANSERLSSRVKSATWAFRHLLDQCRKSAPVCDSIGHHRFGVVITQRAPARVCSATNSRWSASSPTCSITALEKTRSKAPSAKGKALPSAMTAGHGAPTGGALMSQPTANGTAPAMACSMMAP